MSKVRENKFGTKKPIIVKSLPTDLYSYTGYIGKHKNIKVEAGDSAWIVDEKGVKSVRGPVTVSSKKMCIVIRGYAGDNKSSGYESLSNLPYVNGCSSNQLIAPIRLGDPTAQLLYIQPFCSEQAHHVHPTARCVYVLKGKGKSVQGMPGNINEIPLKEGDVIMLDKMVPHHFETKKEELIVIPIHIFSSTRLEFDHPMMNGTHKV